MSKFGHTFGRWYVCLNDTTGHITGQSDDDDTIYFDHDGEKIVKVQGTLSLTAKSAISSAFKRRRREMRLRAEVEAQQ